MPFGTSEDALHNGFPVMGGVKFKILGFSFSSGHNGYPGEIYTDGTQIIFELMKNGASITTELSPFGIYFVIDFKDHPEGIPRTRYTNYLTRLLNKTSLPLKASVDDGTVIQPEFGSIEISEASTLSICYRGMYDDNEQAITPESIIDMDFNNHKISLWCMTTNDIQLIDNR